jgi:RNA polymerase sigma factor (sigma-70 family)
MIRRALFLPWLMSIAHNRMVDRFRKFSRGAAHEILVTEIPETFSSGPTNYQGDRIGDIDDLRHAVLELPASQRRAIEMIKLRELSSKEASEQSGLTIGNLKILVHRAIKSLP